MFSLSPEKEVRFFEFYASHIWPVHRLFAKRHYSKRCARCGIAEEASPLDQEGVCALCHAPQGNDTQGNDTLTKELDALFESHQGKGQGAYDAVVLFSGGKDSSFLLHTLQIKYPKLRLLALTVDNSFMSSVALANIDWVVRKLNVDHITLRLKPKVFEDIFRFSITNLSGEGCSLTVDKLDGEFLIDQGRRMAAELSAPLLVVGYSHEQTKRLLGLHSYETQRDDERKKRDRAALYDVEELSAKDDLQYWWDGTRYPEERVPRVILPYYAWDFNEEHIKKEVARLGLIRAKKISPLVTNNHLIPLEGLVDVAHLGYSSWEPEFTQMVRDGKADKKYWQHIFELIQYSARTGRFIGSAAREALKRLRLSPKDVGLNKVKV